MPRAAAIARTPVEPTSVAEPLTAPVFYDGQALVLSDAHGAATRRLAVFGPGCIFGESAMLMRGPRTADAVCVKPARLYELRRDALLELEGLFPVIHAKLIANLNLHLATRLAATTEIARGR